MEEEKEKYMYKIYIDTTTREQKTVTLTNNDKEIDNKKGDIDIVTSIKEILKENKIKMSEIEEIISNPGPGSFTGIKIGVTVANVLNWITGKKNLNELTKPNYGKKPNIQKPA